MDKKFNLLVLKLLSMILYRISMPNYKDFDKNHEEKLLKTIGEVDHYIRDNEY